MFNLQTRIQYKEGTAWFVPRTKDCKALSPVRIMFCNAKFLHYSINIYYVNLLIIIYKVFTATSEEIVLSFLLEYRHVWKGEN